MQTKEEIKKIMFEYSDRLLNSMGDYVQCVVVEDWDNLADEILTLLQSNDAGQPNGSKPDVSRRAEDIPAWWWQYKKANPDDKDDYDKRKHCCSRFWKDFCDCMR